MSSWTSALLAKPWLVGLSVALLGVSGAGSWWLLSDHSDSGVHVRVLGEQFQNPGNGSASAGANSAKPAKPPTGGGPKLSFTISADVSGLVLGEPATLPVEISNPKGNGGSLTVNTVNVVAHDITADGVVTCDASNLLITDYDSSDYAARAHVAPKGGVTTVALPIVLKDSLTVDQTACKGKTFTIDVVGTATVTHP